MAYRVAVTKGWPCRDQRTVGSSLARPGLKVRRLDGEGYRRRIERARCPVSRNDKGGQKEELNEW